MKKLLLAGMLFLFSGIALGQEYEWVLETNPDYENPNKSDVIMHDGKLYHMYDSAYNYLDVSVYDPATASWTPKAHLFVGSSYGLQAELVGDDIYIVIDGGTQYTVFNFNTTTELLTQSGLPVSTLASGGNWEFKAGDSNEELFVMYIDNGTNVMLSRFDAVASAWETNDYTSVLNPTFDIATGDKLEMYLTISEIYCGLSGSINRIAFSSITNLSVITPYNSAGSNDGKIYIDNVHPTNAAFYFTGNGQDAPLVNVRSSTLIKTWQAPITTVDINILTGVTTPFDFNITPNAYAVVNDPAYAFLVSNFIANGGGTANKFYLYRQDLGSLLWDSIGPRIENNFPLLTSGSVRLALDNPAGQHAAVQYATNASSGFNLIKVLNRKPFLGNNATDMSGTICPGHLNELYPQFEFYDADVEQIRVLSLSSLNGTISGLTAIASGLDLGINPAVSKFRIYGVPSFGTTDAVIITYTDGWNTYTDTLPAFMAASSTPSVIFYNSPLYLCSNENMIDLEHYVSHSNQGKFTLNGQLVEGSTLNGITESVANPSGTIYYEVSVDGCFVETGVTFSFVTPGTATATTIATTCGSSTGEAQVTFVPGTSSNFTVEWSTGETSANIADLAAGAYYYAVTDEYGCHTTGFASVLSTGLTVTPTIVNSTCAGADNGSISIAVSGAPNYSVLWSNGYSTTSISNLAPGNYEVTVQNGAGCQATYSYMITEPAPIEATFTTFDPDCGVSNGIIYGQYDGGTGGYTFNWLGQGQTGTDLNGVMHGYYEVQVTDASGCSAIFGYQLNDYQSVAINDSILNTVCNLSNGAILVDLEPSNGGNAAESFSWSNGNLFTDNFNLAAGSYTLTAQSLSPFNFNTCYSAKTMKVGTKAPIRQEICLVTVDLETTSNLVIWEDVEFGIDHYNIYRENAVAGTFMLIDTVSGESESLFNDVVASPLDRSWRYRITGVNACGIEGPVSVAHKTLHLNSINVLANGSIDIFWDDYEGQSASEYIVHRLSDQNGWEALSPAVPFGTSYFNDATTTGLTGIDYYVEMISGFMCSSEKAQDFNSSRSNKDKGAFSAGEGTGDSNNGLFETTLGEGSVMLYPNPVSGETVFVAIDGISSVNYSIVSLTGQEVSSGQVFEGISGIGLNGLQKGVYILQLTNNNEQTSIRFIIQ